MKISVERPGTENRAWDFAGAQLQADLVLYFKMADMDGVVAGFGNGWEGGIDDMSQLCMLILCQIRLYGIGTIWNIPR